MHSSVPHMPLPQRALRGHEGIQRAGVNDCQAAEGETPARITKDADMQKRRYHSTVGRLGRHELDLWHNSNYSREGQVGGAAVGSGGAGQAEHRAEGSRWEALARCCFPEVDSWAQHLSSEP